MKTYRITNGQRPAAAQVGVKATPAASHPLTSPALPPPWDEETSTRQVGLPTQTSERTPVRSRPRGMTTRGPLAITPALTARLQEIRSLLDDHYARLGEYDQAFVLDILAHLNTPDCADLSQRQWDHLERVTQRLRLMSRYQSARK